MQSIPLVTGNEALNPGTCGAVGEPLLDTPDRNPLLQRLKERLRDVENQRLWFACAKHTQRHTQKA